MAMDLDLVQAGLLLKAVQSGVITPDDLQSLAVEWLRGKSSQTLFDYLLLRGILTSDQTRTIRQSVENAGAVCTSCMEPLTEAVITQGKWVCPSCGTLLLSLDLSEAASKSKKTRKPEDPPEAEKEQWAKTTMPPPKKKKKAAEVRLSEIGFSKLGSGSDDPMIGLREGSFTITRFQSAPEDGIRIYSGKSKNGDDITATAVHLVGARNHFHYNRLTAVHDFHHEAFLPILDIQTGKDFFLTVSEPVTGTALSERLESDGPIPPEEALDLLESLAKAVGDAHSRGLILLNLNPESIILRDSGPLILNVELTRGLRLAPLFSPPESVWGNSYYTAPERFDLQRPVPADDIYSLGLIYYSMLTGGPPTSDVEPNRAAIHAVTEDIEVVDLPESVSVLIGKLAGRTRESRFSTISDLLEDIDRVRNGTAPAPFDPPEPYLPIEPPEEPLTFELPQKPIRVLLLTNAVIGGIIIILWILAFTLGPPSQPFKNLPIQDPGSRPAKEVR